MRYFIQIETVNGKEIVTSTLESKFVPGEGPELPPDFVEVTDMAEDQRPSTSWIRDPVTDTWSPPKPPVKSADKVKMQELGDKPDILTLAEQSEAIQLILKRLS
tara:strand:- start:234 stop:545 length:312 start_codon:yes stop_codon:yes gene_type:complete